MADGCRLCPRECGADRSVRRGICGADDKIRIARVGLHLWEEPCLSYGAGSGTIFFSGCPLGCVFCQNREISHFFHGVDVDVHTLASEILNLQDKGASNINFVTPTHYTLQIMSALELVKDKLKIPVCYNCSGYEKSETVLMLKDYIDIFLPDFKYFSPVFSKKYSGAADYFDVASKAIEKMFENVSYPVFDENGHLVKGVLIRHLVLPGLYRDSFKILDYLASKYDTQKLAVSIMSQYFPTPECASFPEINRRLTSLEYQKVVEHAKKLGIVNGYTQSRSSADKGYVPDFDYTINSD